MKIYAVLTDTMPKQCVINVNNFDVSLCQWIWIRVPIAAEAPNRMVRGCRDPVLL